ncbi:FUSC family protein, partial [Klebsiella pneumoniae]
ITEVTIGFNYALGQVTVTPMALLMTYMASPAPASNMPVERVVDTIVGAAIGIVFAVIFSTVDDRVHLARRYRKLRIWR